jgi:hypothetical protein
VPNEQEKQTLTQQHPIITYHGICIVNKNLFSEILFSPHHKPRDKRRYYVSEMQCIELCRRMNDLRLSAIVLSGNSKDTFIFAII